jgi:NAD(P)-dependent dehydrogenase (short-subunit alcohol dehydrogenase family)
MSLRGKTVVITGAGRGIGRACAIRCADAGADLALYDVAADIESIPYPLATREQLERTAELCRARGASALTVVGDVRDAERVKALVASCLDRYGSIDALINSAGIAAPSGVPVHEIEEADWSLMLGINLSGVWRMIKAVVPHMVERRCGSIVNVASTAGLVGYRHFAGYVAAKHGVIGLTKAAALDCAPLHVRVNAICPGSVRDEPSVEGRMLSDIARSLRVPLDEYEHTFTAAQPTNELVDPWQVAATAVWFASDDARHVTGAVLAVDGGFTAR